MAADARGVDAPSTPEAEPTSSADSEFEAFRVEAGGFLEEEFDAAASDVAAKLRMLHVQSYVAEKAAAELEAEGHSDEAKMARVNAHASERAMQDIREDARQRGLIATVTVEAPPVDERVATVTVNVPRRGHVGGRRRPGGKPTRSGISSRGDPDQSESEPPLAPPLLDGVVV